MPRALVITVCLTAVTALAGCGGGGADKSGAGPQKPTVSMKALRFHPATLAVRVGQTVTWRNDDTVDHNVTATKGERFHSRAFGSGRTYTFTPNRAGLVNYVCTLHPGMEAALLVRK